MDINPRIVAAIIFVIGISILTYAQKRNTALLAVAFIILLISNGVLFTKYSLLEADIIQKGRDNSINDTKKLEDQELKGETKDKVITQEDPIKNQIQSMTLEEKIGQMLIIGMDGYEIDDNAKKMIEDKYIGGFILYSSNVKDPKQLLNLINDLKKTNELNQIPLFISIDEEGGRVSRMPSEFKKFPTNKEIGKVNSKELAYEIGRVISKQIKGFGFNMNYAPVLDINSNPKNPVIGNRAFGSDKDIVEKLGISTMKGLQDGGVISVIKHFPGHGDTSVDSHKNLPVVDIDLRRLNEFEIIPFKNAINNGGDAIMVAHILLTKIDPENPSSLSKTIITDILRKQLDYEGVVITDDMTMGAIVKNYTLEDATIKSVNAGSDIVLIAHGYENSLSVLKALKEAVGNEVISEERIDESVYRILKLKEKYNINNKIIESIEIESINKEINDILNKYFY